MLLCFDSTQHANEIVSASVIQSEVEGGVYKCVNSALLDESLITVRLRLERTFNRHTDIIGLMLVKYIQFHSDFSKVQTGNFLIQ